MKDGLKVTLIGLLVLLVLIGITFFKLGFYRFFKPKFENARREVFEETKSYNQAKFQDLLKYKLEHDRAETEEEEEAIAFTVRHRFADYDEDKLPAELKDFLKKMKYGGF